MASQKQLWILWSDVEIFFVVIFVDSEWMNWIKNLLWDKWWSINYNDSQHQHLLHVTNTIYIAISSLQFLIYPLNNVKPTVHADDCETQSL